jgi:hypothetical protein
MLVPQLTRSHNQQEQWAASVKKQKEETGGLYKKTP